MEKSVHLFYFSPNKTTLRMATELAGSVAKTLNTQITRTVSLLKHAQRDVSYAFSERDIVVIGLPVYEGRVPEIIVKTLQHMKGHNTIAIIGMVYGNRDFDDALLEMKNLLEPGGFTVIAAGAFIGQHAFTSQVATDRPDLDDLLLIRDFGEKAAQKVEKGEVASVTVPGSYPYKEPLLGVKDCPKTSEPCNNCMICVSICPTDAIDAKNPKLTDIDKCILCQACIKSCPLHARYLDNERIKKVTAWLERKFAERKSPSIFL